MFDILKAEIRGLVTTSKRIKSLERHILGNVRSLKGSRRKKHSLNKQTEEIDFTLIPRASEAFLRAQVFALSPENAEALPDIIQKRYDEYWGLTHYRKNQLRKSTRLRHLALAFLKGQEYDEVESEGCYEGPDFDNVFLVISEMTRGQEENKVRSDFEEWKTDAIIYLQKIKMDNGVAKKYLESKIDIGAVLEGTGIDSSVAA